MQKLCLYKRDAFFFPFSFLEPFLWDDVLIKQEKLFFLDDLVCAPLFHILFSVWWMDYSSPFLSWQFRIHHIPAGSSTVLGCYRVLHNSDLQSVGTSLHKPPAPASAAENKQGMLISKKTCQWNHPVSSPCLLSTVQQTKCNTSSI